MPSPLRDPKALSDWLELDYYRRPRRLRRVRRTIIWATLLAAVIVVALTIWPGQPALYQAGPLSSAHAMFNDRCELCHTEPFQTARRFWPTEGSRHSVPDEACIRCHAGPLHNQQQVRLPACASCHQEHRGRNQLARVASTHCTACHADLQRKDGGSCPFGNVTRFDRDHPEFAIWRQPEPSDPSRLHFNHQVHLKPEGLPGRDGRRVQLQCAACHRPDAERRYMQPVTYDQHCASCHPLSVQLAVAGNTPAASRALAQFRQEPAPHRPPTEVRATLRDRLARLLAESPGLVDAAPETQARPLPGQADSTEQVQPTAAGWIEQQLRANERILFDGAGGCAYCHVRAEAGDGSRAGGLPAFEPPRLPRRWFSHSRFSHDSHRMLSCLECHPASDSQRTADVLMPRIASCQQCHNPRVGARSDCVDCHCYHDRSLEKGWIGTLSIRDCLGGAVPNSP